MYLCAIFHTARYLPACASCVLCCLSPQQSDADDLVTIATSILYETSVDPSLYDDRMREFLHALKEGTVSNEDLGSVAEAVLQQVR